MSLFRPESADLSMPLGSARLAVLCGPTAALSTAKLLQSTAKLSVRPKVSIDPFGSIGARPVLSPGVWRLRQLHMSILLNLLKDTKGI